MSIIFDLIFYETGCLIVKFYFNKFPEISKSDNV